MKKAALFLVLTLIFITSHAMETERPVSTLSGTVTWIYDGDTLKVEPHGKVRLIGIDTPEKSASSRDRYLLDQGVSPERIRTIYHDALHFNIDHVKGMRVQLFLDDTPRDRHGRLLAYVTLPDGRLLNKVLIERGLAVVYQRFDFKLKEDFLAAEATARQNKRGLWEE